MTIENTDALHVGAGDKPTPAPLAGIIGAAPTQDYGGDTADASVTIDSLEQLRNLAQTMLDEARAVTDADAALKAAVKRLKNIQEDKLPALMKHYGLPRFEFIDGYCGKTLVVKKVDTYYVAMPKNDAAHEKDRAEIFEWLVEVNQAGSIKKTFEINLGLSADGAVDEIQDAINATGKNYDVKVEKKIEPATLRALVIKMKDDGENVHPKISVSPASFADFKLK